MSDNVMATVVFSLTMIASVVFFSIAAGEPSMTRMKGYMTSGLLLLVCAIAVVIIQKV